MGGHLLELEGAIGTKGGRGIAKYAADDINDRKLAKRRVLTLLLIFLALYGTPAHLF